MWLLDLGNTALKAAWWEGDALSAHTRIAHDGDANTLAAQTAALLANHPQAAVRFCSVAPTHLSDALSEVLEKAGGDWRQLYTEPSALGLRNAYPNHRQMGVDRWLAMLGAWVEYQDALVVVDVGTALTIDLIDRRGQHLGGYILPGRAVLATGLRAHTGLCFEPGKSASLAPGTDTQTAINNGLSLALTGAVERAIQTTAGPFRHYLLTGGGGPALLPLLPQFTFDRDLVFKGLMINA